MSYKTKFDLSKYYFAQKMCIYEILKSRIQIMNILSQKKSINTNSNFSLKKKYVQLPAVTVYYFNSRTIQFFYENSMKHSGTGSIYITVFYEHQK